MGVSGDCYTGAEGFIREREILVTVQYPKRYRMGHHSPDMASMALGRPATSYKNEPPAGIKSITSFDPAPTGRGGLDRGSLPRSASWGRSLHGLHRRNSGWPRRPA